MRKRTFLAGLLPVLISTSLLLAGCNAQKSTEITLPPTPATPGEPGAVVDQFLTATLKDLSSAASSGYLTTSLQEVVDHGHPLLELLGMNTMYKSFDILASQVDDENQRATVQVNFSPATPAERDFSLVLENGAWRINTLVSYGVPAPNVFPYYIDANNLILEYFQALSNKDVKVAWSLLDGNLQAVLNEPQLVDQANTLDSITVTNLDLTSDQGDRLVYHVLLWASPNPDHLGEWADGQNERWISVTPNDSGWSITQISGSPIS
jgi:hypothetical protein